MSNLKSGITSLEYRGIHRQPRWPTLDVDLIVARTGGTRSPAKQAMLGKPKRRMEAPIPHQPAPSFKVYRPLQPADDSSVYRLTFVIFLGGELHDGWWIWDRQGNPLNNGPEIHISAGEATIYLMTFRRPWIRIPWIIPGRTVERYDYYELKWVRWSAMRAIVLEPEQETAVVFTIDKSAISWPHMQIATPFDWDRQNDQWTSSQYESDDY